MMPKSQCLNKFGFLFIIYIPYFFLSAHDVHDISNQNHGIEVDGTIANPVRDQCVHGCRPDKVVMLVEPKSARLLGNLDVGFPVAGIICWIELVIACHGRCCNFHSFVGTSVFYVTTF